MTSNLIVSPAPHITKRRHSTRRIMLDVIISLVPVIVAATYFFGHLALINLVSCVAFCFISELVYSKFVLKIKSYKDLSCVVTGIILSLNLPTTIDIWGRHIEKNGAIIFSFDTMFACLLASVVAIVLVKMLFGGIGKNFANPAAVGRVFLFVCFTFPAAANASWVHSAVTGATPLASQDPQGFSLLQLFLGQIGAGAVGETCVIAILIGFIYLSVRRVIDYRIPIMVVFSAAIFALFFKGLPDLIGDMVNAKEMLEYVLRQLLSGGLVFGAVYMATDYATSPNSFVGNVIFVVGIGLFTMMIRVFAAAPEGFSFALIIMNILTPIIDRYVFPRPFGYKRVKKEAK